MSDDRKLWERYADWDFAFQVVFIVVMFIVGFVWWLLDR
jgi:hypothetical protein